MTLSTNFYSWVTNTMNLTLDIILTILILGIALGIGLILRLRLVQRLEKTVLDNWIIQTLGVLVALSPLIIAGTGIPLVWQPSLIHNYWITISGQLGIKDVTSLAVNLIETLLLIGLGIGIARTVQRLAVRGLGENHIDINIRTLIGRIFYFIILTFAVFWILSIWQVSIGVPVTVISVLTIAVAVSIQDILKDLVAGFYILVERPFHIGDQISTTGGTITYVGTVEAIELRATKLRLVSGEETTIPNSLVFGNIIVNNTFYGQRRATITATMPQDHFFKDETPAEIVGAIKELESVIAKPEPAVMLSNYTAREVTLTIRFWIGTKELSTVTDVMYTLHKALPEAELTVQESAGNV